MRTYRSKGGQFAEKPFFQPEEIESICVDELRKIDLYPAEPSPVRIERFVEKRFKIQPTYEHLPPGLLGFTRFGAKGVEAIVVTTALDEEGSVAAERRVRTTLAHEAGHGLLHAHLFALGMPSPSLFGEDLATDSPKILCRDEGVLAKAPLTRKKASWSEFQANMAMGALLLPKGLVETVARPFLVKQGMVGLHLLPDDQREAVIRLVAGTFDVNPVVARIRLEALYRPISAAQLTL